MPDLFDAPTALAACCGFDLCHKYVLYLYLYTPIIVLLPMSIIPPSATILGLPLHTLDT